MKIIIIAILASCALAAQALTWDDVAPFVIKCGKLNGLTLEQVRATEEGTNLEDPNTNLKNHIVCCLGEAKWLSATGEWNVEKIKDLLSPLKFTEAEVKKVVECVTKKDTISETGLEFWRCAQPIVGPHVIFNKNIVY